MKRLFRSSTAVETDPGNGSLQLSGNTPESEETLPEMGFLDHLEDLRWSILKGLGSLVVVTIVAAFFGDWILSELLLGPTHKDFFMYDVLGFDAVDVVLQSRNPTGQFFAYMGTIVSAGVVMGSPLVVYFLWKFIEPGLYKHERQGARFAALFATFFFVLGLAFGYLIITPLALQFFAKFQIDQSVVNEFDIRNYFNMLISWSFGVGLLFELPVVMYFLAVMGVVNARMLRMARKYALIGALILGAIFTPPDPISQVLVATPLMLLFEFSIVVVAWVDRRRTQREKAREATAAAEVPPA